MDDLTDKFSNVSGVGFGIGRAATLLLAAQTPRMVLVAGRQEERRELIVERVSLSRGRHSPRRKVKPHETVEVESFLLSDRARFISGTALLAGRGISINRS